jgi:predicted AAA+ superfamily ATPase
VAVNTIKKWISILEASRIIYLLRPYYRNLGKRITKSPKIYFLDCGLACHLLSLKDKDYLLKGPMGGPLFENFCVQETIKAIFNHGKRADVYYIRTQNGLEVDMIVEIGRQLFPIEIKMTKTPALAMGESMRRIRKLFPGLPIGPGRIVSLSRESFALEGDLSVQSVDDFVPWLKSI